MKKVILRLDSLLVESFATEAAPAASAGTVRGHDGETQVAAYCPSYGGTCGAYPIAPGFAPTRDARCCV
jgi:hypothetical protein